jgi:hypothetical protein
MRPYLERDKKRNTNSRSRLEIFWARTIPDSKLPPIDGVDFSSEYIRRGSLMGKRSNMMSFQFKKDTPQLERMYHEIRVSSGASFTTVADSILSDMHTLDSKSAALLQFISVVLVALTFSLGLVDQRLEYASYIKGSLILFIGLFAFAAGVNFRCLQFMGPPFNMSFEDASGYENGIIIELAIRRYRYFLSLHIARLAFFLLLLLVVIWVGMVAREII